MLFAVLPLSAEALVFDPGPVNAFDFVLVAGSIALWVADEWATQVREASQSDTLAAFRAGLRASFEDTVKRYPRTLALLAQNESIDVSFEINQLPD